MILCFDVSCCASLFLDCLGFKGRDRKQVDWTVSQICDESDRRETTAFYVVHCEHTAAITPADLSISSSCSTDRQRVTCPAVAVSVAVSRGTPPPRHTQDHVRKVCSGVNKESVRIKTSTPTMASLVRPVMSHSSSSALAPQVQQRVRITPRILSGIVSSSDSCSDLQQGHASV